MKTIVQKIIPRQAVSPSAAIKNDPASLTRYIQRIVSIRPLADSPKLDQIIAKQAKYRQSLIASKLDQVIYFADDNKDI